MSRVEELDDRRDGQPGEPGCCETCRIACVIANHGEPDEVEANEPELRRAA